MQDTIGNTPLVLLKGLSKKYNCNIWAKLEGHNPGLSIKDRIVWYMLNEAEQNGLIEPGKSTIVEASSGNTGYSLAMIGAIKGYKVIVTLKDKTSPEKVSMIEAMGAEVVLCPSSVDSEHPDSYYSKAQTISQEIDNGYYLNQNFNDDNYLAHYSLTAPEIWEQTSGKVSYILASSSTGGTISGLGRYLKEQNSAINVIGVDCKGSCLSQFFHRGKIDPIIRKTTCLEGVGKDIIPSNFKVAYIDDMIVIDDGVSIERMLDLCANEGIMAGGSSGAVMAALDQIADKLLPTDEVVLVFPDHGSKYLSKYYSEEWRAKAGFVKLKEEAA